jgi:membrane protease subunit HflC
MDKKKITYLVGAVVLIIIISNTLFIVSETEQVIITQFGQPVREAIRSAGLNAKIPFIQKLHYFDKRILEWDGESSQIPTLDKKFIWVDTFIRWRINDPLLFYQTNRNMSFGYTRLDDIIDGVTRDIITQNELFEIVRSTNRKLEFSSDYDVDSLDDIEFDDIKIGREKIADTIWQSSSPVLLHYGIEVVDVKIKRINYIESVRRQVYDRMISERKKIAERYRSSGQGRAAEIMGKLQKDLNEIESEAYYEAQKIKGIADAQAIEIYANAYNRDPDFYGFMRTLEAYSKTFNQKSTLILTTDSDLLKYMKNRNSR